ncbi:NAD-dependent dehydratase [Pseudonocardia sulfidoxydans NBRC 16205]|uniref:NAD-dependent dehydratase n=1 Tax=Pseudonocardia sulfidoxydans NBRC 16205 TaxID=1223511 RepID=A0A511DMP1_9PSEU|nr:NAD(P)H-binding protein [Pseudonocardia sulfidoxydans]GEL26085.1 NAD-dependent dehydratase [Pseudonocardia sulfidoxydans NBRC 16205]
MRIVIAGGHGQIALRLATLLAARGDEVVGLVRNPAHVDDVAGAGATAAVVDLEKVDAGELAGHLGGADAVVFAAGAGPGSGVARKDTVDRAAAELLADAAARAGVRRYLLVSAIGIDDEPDSDRGEQWAAYVRAKKAAEDAVRATDLDWTFLRPGRLTDDAGTGTVLLGPPGLDYGRITRDDTAAVLVALLDTPASAGHVLDAVGGDTPIVEAVETAVR